MPNYIVIAGYAGGRDPVQLTEDLSSAVETARRVEELGYCLGMGMCEVAVYYFRQEQRYTRKNLRLPLQTSTESAHVFSRWKVRGEWQEKWASDDLLQEFERAPKLPQCPTLNELERLQIRQRVSAASTTEGQITRQQVALLHYLLWANSSENQFSISKPSGLDKTSANCAEGFHIHSDRQDFFSRLLCGEQILGSEIIYLTATADPLSNKAASDLRTYIESPEYKGLAIFN